LPTTDVHLTIPRDIEGSQVATMLDKEKKKEKVKIMVVAKQQQPIPPKTTVQPLSKTTPTPTPPQPTPKKDGWVFYNPATEELQDHFTIQKDGTFSIKEEAFNLIGQPQKVILGYNKEEGLICVQPADNDNGKMYQLKVSSTTTRQKHIGSPGKTS